MLFSLSHGQHALETAEAEAARSPAAEASSVEPVSVQAVMPDVALAPPAEAAAPALAMAGGGGAAPPAARMAAPRAAAPLAGAFHYYFPQAPGLPADPAMPGQLDALAASMVEAGGPDPSGNSGIPPVLTYFGQFVDHDVTANTDRETPLSVIDGAIDPLDRATVTGGVANLRDGSLALDSLYGESSGSHAFSAKLAGLMRWPPNPAKMRLGRPIEPEGGRVPLPAAPDNATDLLRLGFLLDRGDLTVAELQALEPELRRVFLEADGTPIRARAIIGDARNDENLIVAQLHALMLRFHNRLADATGGLSFRRAQRLTRWHYQWLVVNAYLRRICDEAVLDEIVALGAPRYTAFLQTHGANGPKMPMPLEFSVAAFRFGHTMVRGAYDHNRFFGEAVPGFDNVIPNAAPFNLLFAFTGNGRMFNQPERKQLPSNWVIEWDRWMRTDPTRPIRSARKLDTHLALPLNEMANEHPDPNSLFRKLAARNLRRGYRLNLPTAQGCAAGIAASGYAAVPMLTPAQIAEGSAARQAAVAAGGFDTATPLWFYVLKEAEVLGQGERLGPLGTHLVAETLVGLIANDPDSYWNADGSRWSPDQFRPGDPIDSLEALARFAGMLA